MKYQHTPVMLKEAVEYLQPKIGDVVVDCTLGGGGYTVAIAKKVGEKGKVVAIDADELAIENAECRIKNAECLNAELNNVKIVHANFKDLQKIIQKNRIKRVNGIVFDLGLSLAQLQDRNRGFSFNMDTSIDMSFGMQNVLNAECRIQNAKCGDGLRTENIVNKWKLEKLEEIIRNYGEERYARRIARAVVKARPVQSAKQLAEIIAKAVPKSYEHGRIHPATRTFQALRIATNDELNNLQKALPQAVDILSQGGRLVVVSYHSLEDRIVKSFFKQEAKRCICPPEVPVCRCKHEPRVRIITKKVVVPSEDEVNKNPRARSAKMRVIEKLHGN